MRSSVRMLVLRALTKQSLPEKMQCAAPSGLYSTATAPAISGGQVRTDAPNVPESPPANTVQLPDPQNEDIPALVGDRRDSQQAAGADNGTVDGKQPTPGQSDRADGVGATLTSCG